jgi:hypothetical protein
MLRMHTCGLLLAGLLVGSAAVADGHSTCSKCHDADEFVGMSATDIEVSLRDSGIPPHKKFADLSDEQIQAIATNMAALPKNSI